MTLAIVLLAALAALFIYRKDTRIAYHNQCLQLGGRYLQVMNSVSAYGGPSPRASFVEDRLLRLCYKDNNAVYESIDKHIQALLDVGYFVREEFSMTNRPLDEATNRMAFYQQVRITFAPGAANRGKEDWWMMSGPMSNLVTVTTTKAQMPRWRNLVEEFDRP